MRKYIVIVVIFFAILALSAIIVQRKDKAETMVAVQPKTQAVKQSNEDIERQKKNEEILAKAQKEYNENNPYKLPTPVEEPKVTTESPKEVQETEKSVISKSSYLDFDDCKLKQSDVVLQLAGTGSKTITIIDSPEVSQIKVCTVDGAVLITCSALDGKLITTKTDNSAGC